MPPVLSSSRLLALIKHLGCSSWSCWYAASCKQAPHPVQLTAETNALLPSVGRYSSCSTSTAFSQPLFHTAYELIRGINTAFTSTYKPSRSRCWLVGSSSKIFGIMGRMRRSSYMVDTSLGDTGYARSEKWVAVTQREGQERRAWG